MATRSTTTVTQAAKPSSSTKALNSADYFPHLPPYSDPTTGLVSKLPRSWIAYAQAMRLDRPAGFYAFYVPYVIGTLYAACIADSIPDPTTVAGYLLFFVPFNIVLRGAACVWNDNLDQEFDRRVQRCRHRPIARGAISTTEGHTFTLLLLAALYPPLTLLPPLCTTHIIPAVVLFFVYAYMKRITYYPQVVLGFPFAWALFICVALFNMDPLADNLPSTLALFASLVLWTITYDTIYAHQDIADDAKAGVKGMAVRFQNSTKTLATLLTTAQVGLLLLCGQWSDFGLAYFLGTVGGVAVVSAYHIYVVDLKNPTSCGAYFYNQFWTVGGALAAGLTAEYLTRYPGVFLSTA